MKRITVTVDGRRHIQVLNVHAPGRISPGSAPFLVSEVVLQAGKHEGEFSGTFVGDGSRLKNLKWEALPGKIPSSKVNRGGGSIALSSIGKVTSASFAETAFFLGSATNFIDFLSQDPIEQSRPFREGRLFHNARSKTLEFMLTDDVRLNVGHEQFIFVHNSGSNGLLFNGTVVVAATTTQSAHDIEEIIPVVKRAIANDRFGTGAEILGVVTHDIPAGQDGWVTSFGVVHDIDTSEFASGAPIYLSCATSGALTQSKPVFPNRIIEIGKALRISTVSGSLFVRVTELLRRQSRVTLFNPLPAFTLLNPVPSASIEGDPATRKRADLTYYQLVALESSVLKPAPTGSFISLEYSKNEGATWFPFDASGETPTFDLSLSGSHVTNYVPIRIDARDPVLIRWVVGGGDDETVAQICGIHAILA